MVFSCAPTYSVLFGAESSLSQEVNAIDTARKSARESFSDFIVWVC